MRDHFDGEAGAAFCGKAVVVDFFGFENAIDGDRGDDFERGVGLLVVVAGVFVVVIGLLIYAGGLSWFGRLPGDVRYESGNVRVYIPIVSMLLVSVALTLLFSLLRRFF